MHTYNYTVWFSNGNYKPQCVEVIAGCEKDAIILAQAERIKGGLDYTLAGIDKQ